MLEKVRETPEWKAYIERTSQTDRFLTGDDLASAYTKQDQPKATEVFKTREVARPVSRTGASGDSGAAAACPGRSTTVGVPLMQNPSGDAC